MGTCRCFGHMFWEGEFFKMSSDSLFYVGNKGPISIILETMSQFLTKNEISRRKFKNISSLTCTKVSNAPRHANIGSVHVCRPSTRSRKIFLLRTSPEAEEIFSAQVKGLDSRPEILRILNVV